MRRCLDCGKFIQSGSRCEPHRKAHERSREQRRGPRRDTATHARWARLVKDRDGYRCRQCGSADRVAAHHIRPLSEGGGYWLGNGVTLCHAHHLAAHRGEYGRQATKAS